MHPHCPLPLCPPLSPAARALGDCSGSPAAPRPLGHQHLELPPHTSQRVKAPGPAVSWSVLGSRGCMIGDWFMLILWHLAQHIVSINTIQILLIVLCVPALPRAWPPLPAPLGREGWVGVGADSSPPSLLCAPPGAPWLPSAAAQGGQTRGERDGASQPIWASQASWGAGRHLVTEAPERPRKGSEQPLSPLAPRLELWRWPGPH